MNDLFMPYSEIPQTLIKASFLSANEFRVCAVLHSLNFLKRIFPSQEDLEEKTNLSTDTIQRALSKLEEEGIIVKFEQRTTKNGRFSTNEYKFACGGWNEWYKKRYGAEVLATELKGKNVVESDISKDDATKIEVYENRLPYVRIFNEFIYSSRLNSNELRVFLYLKQFANCRAIYPSYNTLCRETGLSKPTVIKTILSLSEKNLVMKLEQMHPDGGKGSNQYLILNDEELKTWLAA